MCIYFSEVNTIGYVSYCTIQLFCTVAENTTIEEDDAGWKDKTKQKVSPLKKKGFRETSNEPQNETDLYANCALKTP